MDANLKIGTRVLITTDNWFYAPDGRNYKAVCGTIKAVHDSEKVLGVRTNAKSTNWYVDIGNLTIAGCQIHYAVKCEHVNTDPVKDWSSKDGGGINEFTRPCAIYFSDE